MFSSTDDFFLLFYSITVDFSVEELSGKTRIVHLLLNEFWKRRRLTIMLVNVEIGELI